MSFTNRGLVAHVKKALSEKWGYVYGTYGKILTDVVLNQKLKQYPDNIQKYLDFIKSNWMGRRTADCVGLIKSYIWWNGGNIKYSSDIDVSANGMRNKATEKGLISTIPELPGVCVWKNGHIGVYIGNGWVIESRGTKQGVILSPLKGTGSAGWTEWLKCPFIIYEEIAGLMRGDRGEDVKSLQTNLNSIGYSLVVDGSFGSATEGALMDFQLKNQIISTGIADSSTIDAINKKLQVSRQLTWQEIIDKVGAAPDWKQAINTAVSMANADGSLGEIEILRFLPELIVKIYYSK